MMGIRTRMTTPDPDELTAGPGLPRDPHDYAVRRRGLGLAFWAAMAFGLICILAGIAIDRYGPKLFPAPPPKRGIADYYSPAAAPLTPDLAPPSRAPLPLTAAPANAAQPPALASLTPRASTASTPTTRASARRRPRLWPRPM